MCREELNTMRDFTISSELAKQFAYDCFDVIIRDIRESEQISRDEADETETAGKEKSVV